MSVDSVLPHQPTDSEYYKSKLGVPVVIGGMIYNAKGGTALASSTSATSIFNGMTVLMGGRVLPPNFMQDSYTLINTLTQVQGAVLSSASPGGLIRIHARGTMGTTSTPNLTITGGLTIGSTYTAYTTSGAVATVATTAPADWTLDIDLHVQVLGVASTASIYAGGVFQYFSGSNAALQSIPLAHTITTATLDTTGTLTVDGQFTWGTSSASNTITTQMAWIEVVD